MNVSKPSNFSSKFLTFLLNAAGIGLPSQKHARYINLYKYYLLQAFILLTSTQVVLVRNLTTLAEITITLVFINNGIFLNSTTLFLHLKQKYIINILESINEDFLEINSFDTISSSVKFKTFFRSIGAPGVITYLLSISSTVLLFPFSNKEYSDITALPVPSAFPWKVDNLRKYLLTIALQINWLAILSLPVVLIFLFSIYYMIEIRVQYDILCKSIRQFDHSDEWLSLADNFDADTESKVLQSFNCCVKHHQKILK
ncbi:hypothetical protein V9T40_012100 [Parthenolecanium corni]|uniref:Uncharacterized protein n=1 Tax=Parthenolecanium corni TaxID=536013 RepID=A0AAN9T817_9HEMI